MHEPQHTGSRFDYRDPMLYDVMQESGTRLAGEILARARAATDPEVAAALRAEHVELFRDLDEVDAFSRATVEAKTAEYRQRLAQLRERG